MGNENIATIGDDPDELAATLLAVDLGTGESAVEVSAAEQHTCALLLSGAVKCWGKNFFGNLGLEDFRARWVSMGGEGATRKQELLYVPVFNVWNR